MSKIEIKPEKKEKSKVEIRSEKKTNNQARVLFKLILSLLILFSLLFFVKDIYRSLKEIFFTSNPYFTLNRYNIEVHVDGSLSNPNKIKRDVDLLLKEIETQKQTKKINLIELNANFISTNICNNNKHVSYVEILKIIPNGLKIIVTDRVPLLRLFKSKGPLVDRNGFVIPSVDGQTHLPIVMVEKVNINIGEVSNNEQLKTVIEIIEHLQLAEYGSYFDIKKILVNQNFVILLLNRSPNGLIKDNCRIIIEGFDSKKSLTRAAKILASRESDHKTTSSIDASYERHVPVVE